MKLLRKKQFQNLKSLEYKWLDIIYQNMFIDELYKHFRNIVLERELYTVFNSRTKINKIYINLTHFQNNIWNQLSKDFKNIIIQIRQTKINKKQSQQISVNKTEIEQIQEFMEKYISEQLVTINKFLDAQDNDSEKQ